MPRVSVDHMNAGIGTSSEDDGVGRVDLAQSRSLRYFSCRTMGARNEGSEPIEAISMRSQLRGRKLRAHYRAWFVAKSAQ